MGLNVKFGEALGNLTPALLALNDPEIGSVGSRLIKRLEERDCHIEYDSGQASQNQQQQNLAVCEQFKPSARYIPFTYIDREPHLRKPGSPATFTNLIEVKKRGSQERTLIELAHEGNHAEAWNDIPILHASSYNGINSNKPEFVLCPEDAIRAEILTEQRAYATQVWLASLGAQTNPEAFNEAAKCDPITPAMFKELRAHNSSLQAALVVAANTAMETWHHARPADEIEDIIFSRLKGLNSYGMNEAALSELRDTAGTVTFGEYYIDSALDSVEFSPRLRNHSGVIFVKMEKRDFSDYDNAFGPNIFKDKNLSGYGDLAEFFTDRNRARLERINRRFGTEDRSKIPTFREACAQFNMTPVEFLNISRAQSEPTPDAPDSSPS